MIEAVHEVLLHDERIGSIRRRGDFTKFVFDRDYWGRPRRAVLGEWFEGHPRRRPHAVNRVPAWFSNLLPEGRLRDMVVEARGGGGREIDLLLRAGRDLPGAVKVVTGGAGAAGCAGGPCAHPRSAGRAVASGRLGFALAGMTLKFSMSRRGDRLVVPARGRDGDWILKTPDRSYPDLPANELAVMRLAGSVGIDVPEARLWSRDDIDDLGPGAWTSEETRAYAVRRFDRSPGGRVHIEDFAQVLGRFGAGEGEVPLQRGDGGRPGAPEPGPRLPAGGGAAHRLQPARRQRGRPPEELVAHLPRPQAGSALARLRPRVHGRASARPRQPRARPALPRRDPARRRRPRALRVAARSAARGG